MKKIFAILTMSIVITACNNNAENPRVELSDSLNAESPLSDAVNTADSAIKVIEAAKDSATN